MILFRALLVLAALTLTACATSPGHRSSRHGHVSVTLQALPPAGDTGDIRALPPGARLRTGDRFALRVDLSRDLYVYVLHHAPESHTAAVLHPPTGTSSQSAPAVRPLFLPSEGQWYVVDQHPGKESLYVIAAHHELPLDSLDGEVKRSAAGAAERGDPPPELDEKRRGVDLAQRARLDERGIAVVRLWFRHE